MAFEPLSVLVACLSDESERLRAAIAAGGHRVRSRELDARAPTLTSDVADIDIVVVPRGPHADHGLRLIGALSHDTLVPVVAAASEFDRDWVDEAVSAGAWGAVVGLDPQSFRIALRVAVQRASDYHGLKQAFARRATIEQAKGLLMARYGIDGERAFVILRTHSQRSNRKLVDVAAALVKVHALLSESKDAPASDAGARVLGGADVDTLDSNPA